MLPFFQEGSREERKRHIQTKKFACQRRAVIDIVERSRVVLPGISKDRVQRDFYVLRTFSVVANTCKAAF
jgi:hypothetical protein